MSDAPAQSYANHSRYDPLYHFVLLGLLVLNFGFAVWNLIRIGQPILLWGVVMSLAWGIVAWKLREYALTVQDRVIRLEETLRMERLLPADLKARIGELRRRQFVALRFASDAELAARVKEALDEGIGGAEIKKRIVTWRPDHLRA